MSVKYKVLPRKNPQDMTAPEKFYAAAIADGETDLDKLAEDPITTNVLTSWIGTLLSSCMLPFVWAPPQELLPWLQLVLMGLMGALGHFFLLLAYARAPAATLMPYMYAQIGFAALGGWIVFGHVPDRWTLAGMGLVALCGALGAWLTLRESRLPVELPES